MSVEVSKSVAYVAMLSPLLAVSKQVAYFVMLPATDTRTATINFSGDLTLSIDATVGAGAITQVYPRLDFTASLNLRMTAERTPRFDCDTLSPANWASDVVEAKSWTCDAIDPPEACDAAVAANDDLDLINGNRLVTLGGLGLKLVS